MFSTISKQITRMSSPLMITRNAGGNRIIHCLGCTQQRRTMTSSLPQNHPEKGELVYTGTLSTMVRAVKGFSITSSLVVLACQPFMYDQLANLPLGLKILMGGMFSSFIFLTPLLLHMITKRYVTSIYFNAKTKLFTASTITFLLRNHELQFTADDVELPQALGLFTAIIAKGNPLFVDEKFFNSKEIYIHLMGYDKPLDWELPPEDDKEHK